MRIWPAGRRAAERLLVHIVARGRIGQGAEAELVSRYLKRVSWPTRITELSETGGKLPETLPGMRTVALDETGRDLPSRALAETIGRWRDDGVREVRFLIGAANGHDASTRAAADLLLSFGRATWPHLMVRAMLAEQLWRASSILAGHPYHREG